MQLGVDADTAVQDACKVEHDLSDETFARIKEHALAHGIEDPLIDKKEA